MKKIVTLFFFLLGGLVYVQGQSISPQVIGAEGGFGTFGSTTLSSTSGEPATATLVNGTTEVTQGFQQPYYDCTYPAGPITGNISVCPNDQGVAYSVAIIVGATGYNWVLPTGGAIATGANSNTITVNYDPVTSASGNITVSGTNVCGSGRPSSLAVTVKVTPSVLVTPQSAVCTGRTTATLTASGATGYTWAPAANLTPTNATSITETAEVSELTFYTVTGTGSNTCTANVIVPVATVPTGGTITPITSIICSGGTQTLTVTGAAGNDYQWQMSTDNAAWTIISGQTNTTYTTTGGNGNTNKFYRLLANSSCWDVASSTAEVDVSNPSISVMATAITDKSLTLNWTPTGTGNYSVNYTGTSSSGFLNSVTPSKTLTGLTSNNTYSIVVTQTGVTGCSATGTLTTTTLCAVPTNLTATPSTVAQAPQLTVTWSGSGGSYRVYYRPLYSYTTFFTKDVTGATSTVLTKQGNNNLYASNTYQIYVASLNCPTTGSVGQPTGSVYVCTLPNPLLTCPTPTIDTVFSTCPVSMEVRLHTPGSYNVYIQRLTPTLQAVNSYVITGNDFIINAAAGEQYLISADAKCGSIVSTLNIWHSTVTIKPICGALANLVLSNPTCNGFTASWNADPCMSNTLGGYSLSMRQAGSINFNSYGVALPVSPVGPHLIVGSLGPGRNMQVFVRSIYSCNGVVTYGAASQTVSVTTASIGCRDEEPADPMQEDKPAVQQYSQDNDEVFSLYPNPNTGEFTVDLSRLNNNTDEVRIEVLNMIGQTVITQITSISDGHMSEFINLPNGTAAGTYIVRLTAGKNVYTAKMNISK